MNGSGPQPGCRVYRYVPLPVSMMVCSRIPGGLRMMLVPAGQRLAYPVHRVGRGAFCAFG